MDEVLKQAELLAEAILSSEEYINMRLAERETEKDEKATLLVAAYNEKRHAVEEILSDPHMNPGDLAAAGEALENVEHALDENPLIQKMRITSDAFSEMMKKVNSIIRRVVTGEEETEPEGGCTGSCETCGGACHHH